ncbi:DUF6323 family protein [Desulfosporosinus sp. OT]|uniref:DUF6323 family protein n=1 Tax=Desulfosporosinus sp. OT TaxID=913865 RepID=UPI0002239DFE|nr:DUF6323 family protein [Desulfosporosinus sp. OT]EGW40789.1 hypothetical protein DOT_1257 [Desulfosporosinus sp. OT]
MQSMFTLIPSSVTNQLAIAEIVDCNEKTSHYGLILSQADALELVITRSEALSNYGRIEFNGGIISKLILSFSNSPFLTKHNYVATLNDLIETFYYFKNETLDEISDDELISLIKKYFDQRCQGSVELLQNREFEVLARNVRYGISDYEDIYKATEESFDEEGFDE